MRMGAIAETAFGCQLGNLGKERIDPVAHIAQMQRPHAGRVDHPAATRNPVQRASGRRVPPLGIRLADIAGQLWRGIIGTGQGVQQRGFPHPGRADQRHGLPWPAPGGQHPGRCRLTRIHRDHGQIALQGLGLGAVAGEIFGGVRLGQHDDRRRPRLIGQRQIAFQPRRVEIGIAGGDDEHRVDIGRDQLHMAAPAVMATLHQ